MEQLESRIVFSHNGADAYLTAMPAALAAQAEANAAASGVLSPSPFPNITWTTLANGMPNLNSYPSAPAAIFLDFDGDAATGTEAYDRDGSPTTFSTQEQADIVEAWRQVAIYYAMFNITVTTVESSLPSAWIAIGNNISNAYSGVNVFPDNDQAESWSESSYARFRISALTHELGHNFGSWHIAGYDNLGVKTAEYHGAFDPLHGPIMGLDYQGVIHKWYAWHDSTDVATLQDIAADLDNFGGDGYKADDFGGTIATATPLTVVGNTQARMGIIERLTDSDAFSFTSTGGRYAIGVGREAPSGVDVKLSIYKSDGTLLAVDDGDPRQLPYAMVNDSHLTLDLPAGTYYIVVQCHGNYGDQGQYNVRVDPMAANWNSKGVGLVGIPGYVNFDSATNRYIVGGSGDDIWNAADSFHYLYQTLTGDGTITARLESQDNTDGNAKAGIMIRESLVENSRNAMLEVKPGNTTHFQYRTSTGGSSASVTGPTGSTWRWMRLTRTGNVIKAEVSTNGTSWTNVGSQTVSMGATVYIGLATTSHNNLRLNSAVYSNVAITGNLNAQPTLNSFDAPNNLAVTAKTATTIGLSWTPITVPGDINGDGAVNNADLAIVKASFGSVAAPGAPGDVTNDGVVDISDYNLVRNNFGLAPAGYAVERSKDGVNFTQIGTTVAGVTTFNDTGLSPTQQYFYRVRTRGAADVSAPSSTTTATTRAGAITSLNIISYTSSTLILDWTDASGETSYRLERSLDGTTGWTNVTTLGKNVPMYVNGGLAAGTQYFYRVVTIDSLGDASTSNVANAFTRLAAVGDLRFTNKASNQMAIEWNAVTGATGYRIERSTDRANWTTLVSSQAGLTYADNAVAPVEKYYYRVTALNSSVPGVESIVFAASPSATALPSPWSSIDIGVDTTGNARSGAVGVSGSTVTMIGAGTDIWNSSDQFRFTYVSMTGNGSITARVVSVENTDFYARAGVMIRNTTSGTSTSAGSKQASMMVHQSDASVRLQRRTNTNGSTAETTHGTVVVAPYWVRMTRTGTSFQGELSADGVTWVTLDTRTITMNNTVLVGLALTPRNYDNNLMNKVVFDNVTVVTSSGTILLTSGSAGSAASAPSSGIAGSRPSSIGSLNTRPGMLSLSAGLSQLSNKTATSSQLSSKTAAPSTAARLPTTASAKSLAAAFDTVLSAWSQDRNARERISLAGTLAQTKTGDAFFTALGRIGKS
jgi:regulation of enolase protein 1 (concanavalin A-like superfamily)